MQNQIITKVYEIQHNQIVNRKITNLWIAISIKKKRREIIRRKKDIKKTYEKATQRSQLHTETGFMFLKVKNPFIERDKKNMNIKKSCHFFFFESLSFIQFNKPCIGNRCKPTTKSQTKPHKQTNQAATQSTHVSSIYASLSDDHSPC